MHKVKSEIKSTIIIFVLAMVLLVYLPAPVSANDAVGFYTVGGSWANGVKYYKYTTSQIQLEAVDNAGHGLSIIDGGIRIYNQNNNLVAVQCNEEDARLNRGFCQTFYDIASNGKLVWTWDQKYYTGNPKKDDANNDGVRDFVPKGTYYGFVNTVPYQNYGAAITEYKTAQFVLDDDSDADGIPNGADVCPQTNGGGTGSARGCPDGDGDGVPDEKDDGTHPDKCLNAKEDYNGYKDGDGCPDELFAGGPEQGRLCVSDECKQAQLKNEARREGQHAVARQAASTLASIFLIPTKERGTGKGASFFLINLGFEVVEDYFIVKSTTKIIDDPPDQNYKVLVELKQTHVKGFNEISEETQILNELFFAGRDYSDTINAFVSANEKYMGAKEADDKYWMKVHAAEVREYAALAARNLEKFNDIDKKAEEFILNSNNDIVITKAQLANFQTKLQMYGASALPQEEIEMLKNLGGNDADLENMINHIINVNVSTWVEETVSAKGEKFRSANAALIKSFDLYALDFGQPQTLTNIAMFISFVISVAIIGYYLLKNEKRFKPKIK